MDVKMFVKSFTTALYSPVGICVCIYCVDNIIYNIIIIVQIKPMLTIDIVWVMPLSVQCGKMCSCNYIVPHVRSLCLANQIVLLIV